MGYSALQARQPEGGPPLAEAENRQAPETSGPTGHRNPLRQWTPLDQGQPVHRPERVSKLSVLRPTAGAGLQEASSRNVLGILDLGPSAGYSDPVTKPKIIDLDAEFAFDDTPAHTRTVKLFGRDWTIQCGINTFAAINFGSGDINAVTDFLRGMIAPDEWPAFAATMSQVRGLDGDKLVAIINRLTEVATDFPTTPPSGSRTTPTRRTSKPNSAAVSRSAARG